jgi:hypothetical protein
MISKKEIKKVLLGYHFEKRFKPVQMDKRMYIWDRETGLSRPITDKESVDSALWLTRKSDWRPLHEWRFAVKLEKPIIALAKAKAKKVI